MGRALQLLILALLWAGRAACSFLFLFPPPKIIPIDFNDLAPSFDRSVSLACTGMRLALSVLPGITSCTKNLLRRTKNQFEICCKVVHFQ